jgi:hypothetical protein
MPKVKFPIKKNEFISPKSDMLNYHFVVKIDLHNVIVRREKDDELLKIPIHTVNLMWSKVDPDTVEILYGQIKNDIINNNDA